MKGYTRIVMSIALLLWLAGCASPSQPSRFYRLASGTPPLAMPQPAIPAQPLPLIGVGPVQLAGYLDRPQIVTRSTTYRLQLHEFDRWAGTLQENTLQVLSDVLQRELPGTQVIGYPWHNGVHPDYEVLLTINRFEREGGRVRLDASWTLLAQPQGHGVRLGRLHFEAPVDDSSMEAVVAAASDTLEQLARSLAVELAPLLRSEH